MEPRTLFVDDHDLTDTRRVTRVIHPGRKHAGNPVLRAESHPQPSSFTDYIGFNTLGNFPELANPDVRMALCKAIDKETLIAQIYQGFGNPAWESTRSTVPWWSPNCRAMVPTRHLSTWK